MDKAVKETNIPVKLLKRNAEYFPEYKNFQHLSNLLT